MAEMLGRQERALPAPGAGVPLRTASMLNANHGENAMAEAVRHGMVARQRGDEAATAFWCTVCSLLVHMRQAGTSGRA